MAKKAEHYSIIIIGGGPIGLACALEAKKAKLTYLILEKGTLVNSLYNYPTNMTFFSTSERLEIGKIPFVSNNAKPTRSEALEYYRRVTIANALNIHLFEEVKKVQMAGYSLSGKSTETKYAQNAKAIIIKQAASSLRQAAKIKARLSIPASNITQQVSLFKITTAKSQYTCNSVIIATGFYDIPYLLNVSGEDLPKVKHFYNDPHYYAFQRVAVVGASNSAVDAALETWRKGAEVTMVIRGPEIGKRVKYWVRPDIENRIKEGSIKAYFNSSVKQIKEDSLVIQTPTGPVIIPNDWVIAMTGYQPDLTFLKKIGIQLSKDKVRKPVYDEKTHETNVPGIYLAGVICGGMNTHRLFIENSRVHATNIIRAIRKKHRS